MKGALPRYSGDYVYKLAPAEIFRRALLRKKEPFRASCREKCLYARKKQHIRVLLMHIH